MIAPIFSLFLRGLFTFPKRVSALIVWPGFILSIFILLTPVSLHSEFLTVFQLYLLAATTLHCIVIALNLKTHFNIALIFFICVFGISVVAGIDMLIANDVIKAPIYFTGLGILLVILAQSHALSSVFSQSFSNVELLSDELENYAKDLETKVEERTQELETANKKLEELIVIDDLTEVSNRRGFDEIFKQEWSQHLRNVSNLSLIICDIDYFKDFNDNYGHLAGDEVLREVAQCISNNLPRATDHVARYGGEEFAIILPNTDADGAYLIAQRLNKVINDLHIDHATSPIGAALTISCGVASTIPSRDLPAHSLIALADEALYEAKAAGRNTTIAAS